MATDNKDLGAVAQDAAITAISEEGVESIGMDLRLLLADVFTLYLKTKNFHWHMSGPHFRDYHLLLDEHGDQLFAMSDPIAERARKLGALTLHSIGEVSRLQRLQDDDRSRVAPTTMLAALCSDNRRLAASMRSTHKLCDDHGDVATTSLLENWIDEAERRAWFLAEMAA